MLLKIKCIISWLSIIILQRHVPMKVTKLFKLFKRRQNTTDDDVIGLLDRSNVSVLDEKLYKDAAIVSTHVI